MIIVDYGTGNLGSVVNMLKRIGVDASVSSDPAVIAEADKIILPGVGAFDTGMQHLNERGLIEPLTHAAQERRVPVLGFCLGMQLLSGSSEEGQLPGLDWIPGRCVKITPSDELRVPHMGWNRLDVHREHPLLAAMEPRSRFYFVHSYHVVCDDDADLVATTDYGGAVTAVIARDNIWGTQFHPEKSHKFGMRLLSVFASDRGAVGAAGRL